MIILRTYRDLEIELTNRVYGENVGFVPTMGALHAGHISLINLAKAENEVVVCSIFVNPTQFNDANDYDFYPRNLDADYALLKDAGCDIVFSPESPDEVYNHIYEEIDPDLMGMDGVMEGEFRPGHFKGVVNVVNQFFKLINPTRAYFGEKDFQQLAIIRQMVSDQNLSVQIVSVKTLREANGLAYSSRNERLTMETRSKASVIYDALKTIRHHYLRYSLRTVMENAKKHIESTIFSVEYIVACDSNTLLPLAEWHDASEITICAAVYADDVRLIDNLTFQAF